MLDAEMCPWRKQGAALQAEEQGEHSTGLGSWRWPSAPERCFLQQVGLADRLEGGETEAGFVCLQSSVALVGHVAVLPVPWLLGNNSHLVSFVYKCRV